ncbi:MAG: hypothetical protein WCY00_00395 [Candidatus Dojkabacteria bacterium]|jgi:rubrerythrin
MDDILKVNEQSNTNSLQDQENYNPNYVTPDDLDSRWLRWKCLVCGYIYEGVTPIKVCPKCGNQDPDKFDDAE